MCARRAKSKVTNQLHMCGEQVVPGRGAFRVEFKSTICALLPEPCTILNSLNKLAFFQYLLATAEYPVARGMCAYES